MKKMVVFEMDNTVLHGRFLDTCAKKYNFLQAMDLLRNIDKNSISLAKRVSSFLKGKSIQELVRLADEMPMTKDINNVIAELRSRGYAIGLITDSYQVIAEHICKKIGGDFCLSYELAQSEGYATGEVKIPSSFCFSEESTCDHPVCKTNALRSICREMDVELENTIVVGDSDNDLCMIRHAGVGVAFCTSSELLRAIAPKKINDRSFSELLEYAP